MVLSEIVLSTSPCGQPRGMARTCIACGAFGALVSNNSKGGNSHLALRFLFNISWLKEQHYPDVQALFRATIPLLQFSILIYPHLFAHPLCPGILVLKPSPTLMAFFLVSLLLQLLQV